MPTSDRQTTLTRPEAARDVLADPAGASRALRAAVAASSAQRSLAATDPAEAPGPAVKLLYGTLLAVAAAYAISVLVRPTGDSITWLDGWGTAGFELLASLLIVSRAAMRPADRKFALWLGMGGVAWAAGDFYNTAVGGAPTPSLNNWLWACFFPLAYVGVMLLIQRDVRRLTAANFLDGVIAALVTGAALVAFAFHAIESAAGGSATVAGWNLVYPVADLLLAGLTGLGIAMAPRGQRARWYLMTAGGLVDAAGDIAALFPSLAAGHVGNALNVFAWPVALALFAAAVWLTPVSNPSPRESRSSGFAIPAAASGVALVILLVGSLNHTDQVALGLATATLLAAGVRFGLALRRLNRLTEERHQELEGAAEAERASRETLAAAVRVYSAFASRVADGDLTAVVQADASGDLQGLSASLNTMVSGLAEISREIQDGVQEIGASTSEILDSVNRHSVSAGQQSAAISQTSATVGELRATAEEMAERARQVAAQARESVHVSDQGIEAVEAIAAVMEEIRQRVDAIALEIVSLSERTQQIGSITATVNEIADRSNLLALNAGIEAARAGEHGRGFAVVAEQVRKLAEQSKAATAQVETILNDVRTATRAAVAAGEQGAAVVDRGLELTGQAGEGIRSLAATIREASDAAEVIAGSSQQQSAGVEQIADAITDIEVGTTQFLEGAKQSQRAVENLERLSGQLAALSERYRVA